MSTLSPVGRGSSSTMMSTLDLATLADDIHSDYLYYNISIKPYTVFRVELFSFHMVG